MTTNYDLAMDGIAWKRLEMEEQARARQLMRAGLARIADGIFRLKATEHGEDTSGSRLRLGCE